MIPMQAFATECDNGEKRKYDEGNHFLHHLELHQRVGTAVALKANSVGRHLKTIFEEGQAPRDKDNDVKRGVALKYAHVLKFQVAVPSEDHKDIANDEQCDRENVLHSV